MVTSKIGRLMGGVALLALTTAASAQTSGLGFSIGAPVSDISETRSGSDTVPLVGKATDGQPKKAPETFSVSQFPQEDAAEDALSRVVEVPERPRGDFFGTGMVDLTYGGIGREEFDRGRVAGYIEGTTRGGWVIRAGGDTGEGDIRDLFSDIDARNPDRVLERLRAEGGYLTFGDDSTSYDAAPSSGKIYVRAARDGMEYLWGDFRAADGRHTTISGSDRTLYGARVLYQSENSSAGIYLASPDRASRIDILDVAGGSNYLLSRQDIFAGTETVILIVRDEISGRIIREERLSAGMDYELSPFQGYLVLKNPVIAFPGNGQSAELRVTYEHTPSPGDPDGSAYGLHLSHQTGPLRFSVAGNSEAAMVDRNENYGAAMTYDRGGLRIHAEAARSDGPGPNFSISNTAGLDYEDISNWSAGPADAHKIEILVDGKQFGVDGGIEAWSEHYEAGFFGPTETATEDRSDEGARLSYGPAFLEASQTREGDRSRKDYAVGAEIPAFNNGNLRAWVGHTDRNDPAEEIGSRTFIQVEGQTELSFGQISAFARQTIEADGLSDDNRIGFGLNRDMGDGWKLASEISDGTLGNAGHIALTRSGETGSVSIGVRKTERDPFLDNPGRSENFIEASRNLGGGFNLKGEARTFGGSEDGHDYGVGFGWEGERLAADLMVNRGETGNGESVTQTDIVSAGIRYADDIQSLNLRAERREDTSSSRERLSYGLSGDYSYEASEDWRIVSKLRFFKSEDALDSFADGRYLRAEVGGAWRPAGNDDLTALFLLSRIEDLPGPDQVNSAGDRGGSQMKATVLSADINKRLDAQWSLGVKYAIRDGEVSAGPGDDFSAMTTDLLVGRVDYTFADKWDVTFDARLLRDRENDIKTTGATIGVWHQMNDNARLGVGYHHGGVTSDLTTQKNPDQGFFINATFSF